ncbi:hypothetical protein Tco_0859769 [Tanacetum coccineum]|uniref:Myb-like domain-containing protein n=1 Tax=Tanacetum coccineum TaxID=301880 RepID=A0ABQ5BG12_9ASTR
MFNKKRTSETKTPNSRLQQSVSHLTSDPNFQLSGVSPPVRFRSPSFEYTSQLPHPPQNNNIFYQNRPFNPSYNNQNAFSQSPTGLYHLTMESSTSFQPNHPYSLVNRINLDMDFEHNIFSQDYNYIQDYSMGYGSGHGSAHGSAHGYALVNDDVEYDSPVEEVSPVKPKKPSICAARAKKDAPKEPPKDWTVAEETALCQAWCDVSENNIAGNNMKTSGFWDAVITYFEKETGSTRGYDSIVSKWKNRVRPRIGAFCAIIYNVETNYESDTNDIDVYHKACVEYKMIYKQDFTLEHCYNVLKDHQGWIDIEMPNFYNTQRRKKSKTFETTSGSASGGIDLNDEADEKTEEL